MKYSSKKIQDAKDIAILYNKLIGEWLLLEVIAKNDQTGKLEKFSLISHSKNKDDLYDLMENDEWDWEKKYLFVFADPKSLCEI